MGAGAVRVAVACNELIDENAVHCELILISDAPTFTLLTRDSLGSLEREATILLIVQRVGTDQSSDGEADIQRTPAVAQGLIESRNKRSQVSHKSADARINIALTGGTVDDTSIEVSSERQRTLQIHVNVLSNAVRTGIPAFNVFDQCHGQSVD